MLTISNLQVFYDRAVDALRDVSLEVRAGQIVALLGSNGAGKSTVLKSICGVLYPEDGRSSAATSATRALRWQVSAAVELTSCVSVW
jgi:ABC-type branched-subunit amino acid transport system ATPase component